MDLNSPQKGSLRAIWGSRWVRVSVMIELVTNVQKLTGNKITIVGKIKYETELVALEFRGDHVSNEQHWRSITVAIQIC